MHFARKSIEAMDSEICDFPIISNVTSIDQEEFETTIDESENRSFNYGTTSTTQRTKNILHMRYEDLMHTIDN